MTSASGGAFLLGLPYLWNAAAGGVTSIAVIGLYLAYIAPIVLLQRAGSRFVPGPWTLGRWGRPVSAIAVAWVAFIVILFLLPQVRPITPTTVNDAPVAVGAVLLLSGGWWLLSARHWFSGPRVQGTLEELATIERDLAAS